MIETLHHSSWRAMGATAEVEFVTPAESPLGADLADAAQRLVEDLEARWSRFRPDSELCRLNRAGGTPVQVSQATLELIDAMAAGVVATGGAFDPTLLAPLVGLGYIAPWHPEMRTEMGAAEAVPRGGLRGTVIHRASSTVTLPANTTIDAGGIGKGRAADLAAELLLSLGATTAMVNLGGDLRIAGQPLPAGWPVNIAHPMHGEPIATLAIGSGGVATSGTTLRRWTATDGSGAGHAVHHLLDPATGRPIRGGRGAVIQATAVAGTAAWAEVFATQAVVRAGDCLDDLDRQGIGAMVVRDAGDVEHNKTWRAFTEGNRA
mgnify:CR=1 FL=1